MYLFWLNNTPMYLQLKATAKSVHNMMTFYYAIFRLCSRPENKSRESTMVSQLLSNFMSKLCH